jgi:hypothetical protein
VVVRVVRVLISQTGCSKYMTCIKSEIKFLERLGNEEQEANPVKNGSNFYFLASVYNLAEKYGGADQQVELMKLVKYEGKETVRIDLVVNNGSRWICVKSRKSYQNTDFSDEEEDDDEQDLEDGDDSVDNNSEDVVALNLPVNKLVKQAEKLLIAAKKYPVHFKDPEIVFQFVRLEADGLPLDLYAKLEDLGIKILKGQEVDLLLEKAHQISLTVNLDIPTLVAMVSCMTFDFPDICKAAFDSAPLQNQYRQELDTPLLPLLQSLLAGKKLVCVQDAFNKFADIVATIGGVREKKRFHLLFYPQQDTLDTKLSTVEPALNWKNLENDVQDLVYEPSWKITVIPNSPSHRFKTLAIPNTSFHNLNVFGTADTLSISTITANGKFLRSLEKVVGFKHSAVVHQPRGLIEQKWIKYSGL